MNTIKRKQPLKPITSQIVAVSIGNEFDERPWRMNRIKKNNKIFDLRI